MDRMTEAKRQYHDIPIPEELSERVMLEVKKAESNCGRKAARTATQSAVKKRTAVAAAVAAVLFVAGVNTSEAFAREVDNIPVIGALARILTFRSYEVWTEDLKISVEIPGVEVIAEELAGLEKEVNEDIYSFCERYAQEAEQRAGEYRQIFLDTGGTEEEWAAHEITMKVWSEVKSHSDRNLSLTVKGAESWNSEYSEERYYNLEMETGKWKTLRDILGDDYAQIAGQSILDQIRRRGASDGIEYRTEGWQGVDEDTKFYLNQDQNPVIVLEKYEVAPGAAGQLELDRKSVV